MYYSLHFFTIYGSCQYILMGMASLPTSCKAKSKLYSGPNGPTASILRDMNNTKWCNGLYIQFRQSFAKETFSYDEYLKSQTIQY